MSIFEDLTVEIVCASVVGFQYLKRCLGESSTLSSIMINFFNDKNAKIGKNEVQAYLKESDSRFIGITKTIDLIKVGYFPILVRIDNLQNLFKDLPKF